ncbi:hypothetical protein [Chromobacterium phragmitis]|uniref:Uncharacterized protein n=1 Tax=Chromobacterium phragmitis TaxID=2202141 RepID=A0ABV0J0R8_9NEIS
MDSCFHVGMELYVPARGRYGNERMAKVSSVGRRWVYFDDGQSRFDPKTMKVDGVYSRRLSDVRLELSRGAYLERYNLEAAWFSTRRGIADMWGARAPTDLTLEKIQQVRALVGLPPFEPKK